ncbi:hypothetical protein SAMN06297422_10113 [Lachnospiraceae bacterium]|nr:hypothetical protein SAMN06297422_10113 [Lachnospiraceae bacterium]
MAKEVENFNPRTMEAYNKFQKLLKEKKYVEMARYALDIHNELFFDESYEAERQGYEMFCEKMVQYDDSPEAGDKDFLEKKADILGFGRALKQVYADAQLKVGTMVEEWKDKIRNGEVEELQIKKDDEKFVSAAATDIVVYQTEPGRDLSSGINATLLFQTVVTSHPKWQKLMRESSDKTRKKIPIYDEYQDIVAHTPQNKYILEYIKTKDMPYDVALKYLNEYETPSEKLRNTDYSVDDKHKLEETGKPVFSKVPEYVKLSNTSTIEEVEALRKPHLDKVNRANEYYQNAMQIAELSRKAWGSIRGTVIESLRTEKYKAFRTAIQNAGTIGTEDFEMGMQNGPVYSSAIFSQTTGSVVKELADASREYLQELDEGLNDEAKKNPYVVSLLKTLKDITKQSAKYSQELDALDKILPYENMDELSKNESKKLDEIDRAAASIGMSSYDLMKKRHADERADKLTELNECLEEIAAADRNVYNGSQEYKDAWTALGNLSGQVFGFNQMVGTIIEQGDHNSFIRMQGNREDARKNITDYLAKKAKKKKLSTKTQRRVDAMKRALKALDAIEEAIDKSQFDIDVRNIQKESETLRERAADENRSPEERMAIKAAADGMDKMSGLFCRDVKHLNSQDKKDARSAIAAITIMERKLYSKTGQITEQQYKEQVDKLAADPDFIKATEKLMDKNSIANFCNDTKNSARSLLNDFYEVKNASFDTPQSAAAKAVKKEAAKNKEAKNNEVNNEIKAPGK